MAINRIHAAFAMQNEPQRAAASRVVPALVAVPVASPVQYGFQQQLYQLAYQRAQAAVLTPRIQDRLFSVWN